jgi:tRNA threonylcarbamoyladenosine biosynthesis protein TsaB
MNKKSKSVQLLGVETSSMISGVWISRNDRLLGQVSVAIPYVHSKRLALLVEQMLEHVEIAFPDLDALAISAGPGSFTGLRIGYSLVKGLAHSLNIPIVEVPTLDIWAYQEGPKSVPVLSLIDAHRDEIFYGQYRWENTDLNRISDFNLIHISELTEIIEQTTLLVGGDLVKLYEKISSLKSDKIILPLRLKSEPENWAFCELAFRRFMNGELSDIENSEPLYLRAFKGVK